MKFETYFTLKDERDPQFRWVRDSTVEADSEEDAMRQVYESYDKPNGGVEDILAIKVVPLSAGAIFHRPNITGWRKEVIEQ